MSDHETPSIEELWQIVQEQRAELARLRAQQRDPSPVVSGRPITRAGLLKAAAAVAALAAGSELVGAPAAALADGTEGATTFTTSGSVAVTVRCTETDGTGIEVIGPGNSEATDYWGIYSSVTNGIGVFSTSLFGTAVKAESSSTAANATAVDGIITSSSPGSFSSAVRGENKGTGDLGLGVWGSHAGSGWGMYATSASGIGLNAAGGNGTGVNASGDTGVDASGSTVGVSASGGHTGVDAQGSDGYGVLGHIGAGPTLPSAQAGVAGQASGGFPGVAAASDTGPGVSAVSTKSHGLVAVSQGGAIGVKATSVGGYGVQAQGGKAQLYLVPTTKTGAPTTGTHNMGELYLDNHGALFICTATGTPGSWKKVEVASV